MSKGLAVGLAVSSFALGALLSPRTMAQSGPNPPVAIERGQIVYLVPAEIATCKITNKWNDWVQCEGGMWRNIHTGVSFRIHTD